jgi:two-component system OmpR family sensor kinase
MRLLLPALVICASGGGHLLVNWALRPVDRMSRTAAHMSLRKLAARLPVPPTGDALERLSLSLNQLLARLRDSLQASRRFLADASHELRTPLTIIKGELQEIAASRRCRPKSENGSAAYWKRSRAAGAPGGASDRESARQRD